MPPVLFLQFVDTVDPFADLDDEEDKLTIDIMNSVKRDREMAIDDAAWELFPEHRGFPNN